MLEKFEREFLVINNAVHTINRQKILKIMTNSNCALESP